MAGGARGHSRARTSIVDVELPAADLPLLDVNIRDLHQLCGDSDSMLCWSAQHGLIHNEVRCCNCGILISLQSRKGENFVDGFTWSCNRIRRCQKRVTTDSFFESFYLSLMQLVDCVYWWSRQIKQADACVETWILRTSMIEWQRHIHNISCRYLLDHRVQMGGPGRTVEVDESKFMHRKYHHGHFHEGHWVLRMAELDTNLCLMVAVPDLSAATLLPIITRHVLPGTRILTDGWRAYHQLPGPHNVVNHRLHFVDPSDPTLHTNTVEGSWTNCKAKFREMHGTNDELFDSHLQEFLWSCFRTMYLGISCFGYVTSQRKKTLSVGHRLNSWVLALWRWSSVISLLTRCRTYRVFATYN